MGVLVNFAGGSTCWPFCEGYSVESACTAPFLLWTRTMLFSQWQAEGQFLLPTRNAYPWFVYLRGEWTVDTQVILGLRDPFTRDRSNRKVKTTLSLVNIQPRTETKNHPGRLQMEKSARDHRYPIRPLIETLVTQLTHLFIGKFQEKESNHQANSPMGYENVQVSPFVYFIKILVEHSPMSVILIQLVQRGVAFKPCVQTH